MWFSKYWEVINNLGHSHLPWLTQCLIIIIAASILSTIARKSLARLAQSISITESPYIGSIIQSARLPLSLSVWLMAVGWILNLTQSMIDLPILEVVPLIQRLVIIILLAWFTLNLVNNGYQNLQKKHFQKSILDANTAEIIYKLSQLFIIIAFSLMLLQSSGISISGLLAFGGVGGLAVGLAAKDMLANLFGGLVLYIDKPFHVGEKIKVMGSDVEGWVEEIGWRKTRVRNYDRQPIYVPNALFATSAVINPSRISNRPIRRIIGLRYQDLDKIKAITKAITLYLNSHKELDKHRPIEVRLINYGVSSLDIKIYCFAACMEYEDFLRIQEGILLQAGHIIMEHGAAIAFPTRTLDIDWPNELNNHKKSP
ncbi:MAG: mechanosensitive ion channel [Endozoicomonas sp. (ex Botrylloides leachii)]|nr:mechanosensitive ion channel [Endozoicomonas sp. (ex Botrylloides leachii)]